MNDASLKIGKKTRSQKFNSYNLAFSARIAGL